MASARRSFLDAAASTAGVAIVAWLCIDIVTAGAVAEAVERAARRIRNRHG